MGVVSMSDDGVDQDMTQQWLDEGFAHVAGGVILYRRLWCMSIF
jgi:hypothetical protein